MRTTRRRITQSTSARAAAGCAFLVAIALFIPGVTQRFNTAVQWRPSGPFFSPGQVKFDHSANATMEESPPEEAAAAEGAQEDGLGAAPEQINLAALDEDQLTEALTWWQSSQKIDSTPQPQSVSCACSLSRSRSARPHDGSCTVTAWHSPLSKCHRLALM